MRADVGFVASSAGKVVLIGIVSVNLPLHDFDAAFRFDETPHHGSPTSHATTAECSSNARTGCRSTFRTSNPDPAMNGFRHANAGACFGNLPATGIAGPMTGFPRFP
ncbi:hypothetical protein [Burkholderia metallica]|uniref:hypothetical protein n=1 Tax=Burkholderia metallica TaxID=488729 RepID=UPI0020C6B812|nr:hypothetical protein [Burkholderia metallica]